MSIYISASLLEDFISCNRKVYYRLAREDQVQNKEMIIGEVVHTALEYHWDDRDKALKFIEDTLNYRIGKDDEAIAFTDVCVANYFHHFKQYLTSSDETELKFKIPWDRDVFIVGKMDRISDGKVFDWKTARKPLKNVSENIQFILYNWAYKKLYKANPVGVYYAALTTGALIRYSVDEASDRTLFEEVIPDAIRAIRNKEYTRNGIFRRACFRCSYSDTCLKEFRHEP